MGAFDKIREHIENNKSFVLEAGAGAGKTYTLIQTLNYLIANYGKELLAKHQNIVCITYTNVAKNEIIERMQNNPLVLVSTIHEFLWSTINKYQKQIKEQLIVLNKQLFDDEQERFSQKTPSEQAKFKFKIVDNLEERIDNIKEVYYDDSNFRDFEKGLLKHDDIISISKLIFGANPLLTKIIIDKYPYILIDEYQDTAKETIETLVEIVLHENEKSILLGFYGDSHQKIYGSGVGSLQEYIDTNKLLEVKKEENFRSSKTIVSLLNKIRTNIEQESQLDISDSSALFLYYNNPPRERVIDSRTGREKDEPITIHEKRIQPFKDKIYNGLVAFLEKKGWELQDDGIDKILILTNSKVAGRAGFGELYKTYDARYGRSQRTKQQLLDREHSFIQLFVGSYDKKSSIERENGIEHLYQFWSNKNYNRIISFIKKQGNPKLIKLEQHNDKETITKILEDLTSKRETDTIKQIIEYIKLSGIIYLSDRIEELLAFETLDTDTIIDEEEKERATNNKEFITSLLALPYKQIMNLHEHVQNHTVFSTKHGTKGEEYRNVLVVLDDTEWKQEYNFNKFFNGTDDKPNRLEMTKNLFYVSCSRAKENLIVLMLSQIEGSSLSVVNNWFGEDNVFNIEEYLKKH